jgi:transposase InsO family protein
MNGAVSPALSALDARVLRATDSRYERSPEKVGELAGCAGDVARSTLRRLRSACLVEDDGCRPQRWLRTYHGDVALEHQP